MDAKTIAARAKAHVDKTAAVRQKIAVKRAEGEDAFFAYFIEQVCQNKYLIVSYILNYCFDSAEARAAFGNRTDVLGNTAYHYAAECGFSNILVVLNDKRQFKGKQKFFKYSEKNNAGDTPLDLVCRQAHELAFEKIWCWQGAGRGAGKLNHNPMHCLKPACEGGSVKIVKMVLGHKKCTAEHLSSLLEQAFRPEINALIRAKHAELTEQSLEALGSPPAMFPAQSDKDAASASRLDATAHVLS